VKFGNTGKVGESAAVSAKLIDSAISRDNVSITGLSEAVLMNLSQGGSLGN
jgi:hypothetical protein